MKKTETNSFSPFLKNTLFWIVIFICVVLIGFKPLMYFYETTLFKYSLSQQTFKEQCERLNGADLTLDAVVSLKGQCLETREPGVSGFCPCSQQHIPSQQELESGHTIVVASNWGNTGWSCFISEERGKIKTEVNWYFD